MDCEAASERLPWLLNGSLESAEAEDVRAHLASCAPCRQEMDGTRRAAAVFGAHLPTSAMLDLAWARLVEPSLAEVARVHLDTCAACREELDLARESRQIEADWPEAPAPAPRPVAAWRGMVLPATLAAGLVAGFWWGTRERGPATESPQSLARVSALEAELGRLRAAIAAREAPSPTVAVPRLNLPVFELLPALLQRGAADEVNEVVVPAGAAEIALLLGSDAPAGARATLTLEDGSGKQVWRGEGLVAGPPGGYTVVMPLELVPSGRYVLRVTPAKGAAVAYPFRVRREK